MPHALSFAKFYARARAGQPALIRQWVQLTDTTDEQALTLLSDTARIAKLGFPSTPPPTAKLWHAWAEGRRDDVPLWLVKALVFLMAQMPTHPMPNSDDEAITWAYVWIRLRPWPSCDDAKGALPAHLKCTLSSLLAMAWDDLQAQRL